MYWGFAAIFFIFVIDVTPFVYKDFYVCWFLGVFTVRFDPKVSLTPMEQWLNINSFGQDLDKDLAG